MGCQYSSNKELKASSKTRTQYLVHNYSEETPNAPNQQRGLPANRPEFTAEQTKLVLETWKIIQEDIAKVGVVLFMNLFETHPEVQDVFMPFKGMSKEDLSHSSQLRSHALRVMGTVEKCLARIGEPTKLEEMLHELGERHVMYSAKVDYIDLIGPQFIYAIGPALGDRWTPEMESAWSDLFKFISHVIKEAMLFF